MTPNPLSILLAFLFSAGSVYPCSNDKFSQQVNISVDARLDDKNGLIDASAIMEYINNSNDTLNEIFIHLWVNAFSDNETAFARQMIRKRDYDFHFATQADRGGYQQISFQIDGEILSFSNYRSHSDIAIVHLPRSLLPGDTLFMEISFVLKLPHARFSRPGQSNEAYYATQWYPKPAVYDCNGWNPIPYLHRGEFYSDFGNFELFLTLPSNFVVASTGVLQTKEELDFLKERSIQTRINGTSAPDEELASPSSPKLKTLHFKQENVHDFAWFADKRFRVLMDSITLDSGEMVRLFSFFTHDAAQWFRANSYMAEAVRYMSEKLGDYPWKQITAVQTIHSGGADMEYPAITAIGKRNSDLELERVIVHEVIHNWFYGIIASNERQEPWIDEGFTTYYEGRFFEKKYPDQKLLGPFSRTMIASYFGLSHLEYQLAPYLWYMLKAGQHLDQPPGATSEELSMLNYFAMAYFKASIAIRYLEEYLGAEEFDRIMKLFYQKWKFNHPRGHDLRYVFEFHSQFDLDWFFDGLIGSDKKVNLHLAGIDQKGEQLILSVVNRGDLALPFTVSGIRDDEEVEKVWFDKVTGRSDGLVFPDGVYDRLVIDHAQNLPEMNRRNSIRNTSGLFKRPFWPELQFLGGIREADKPKIYWIPVLGYNVHDQFMPGLAFYNHFFPASSTDIFFMPLYSSGRDALSGTVWFSQEFYPRSLPIHALRAGVKGKRYGLSRSREPLAYSQLESSVDAIVRAPLSDNRIHTRIGLKNYLVSRDRFIFTPQGVVASEQNYFANKLFLIHENETVFNPFTVYAELLHARKVLRTQFSVDLFFPLRADKKGLNLRLFAGAFLAQPDAPDSPDFRLSLQGISPARVVLYDDIFPGLGHRPGTLAGNQTTTDFGGFRFPTPLGLTWDWLVALNLNYDIPGIPFRLFFDAGTYSGAGSLIPGTQQFPYVGGLQLVVPGDILYVNFPVIISEDVKRIAELNQLGDYHQWVTFTLNFDRLNPLNAKRNLHLLLF